MFDDFSSITQNGSSLVCQPHCELGMTGCGRRPAFWRVIKPLSICPAEAAWEDGLDLPEAPGRASPQHLHRGAGVMAASGTLRLVRNGYSQNSHLTLQPYTPVLLTYIPSAPLPISPASR
jgi:hypothetical protein